MTEQDIKNERAGNRGRDTWNRRHQTNEELHHMLAGAVLTIDRLLDALEADKQSWNGVIAEGKKLLG